MEGASHGQGIRRAVETGGRQGVYGVELAKLLHPLIFFWESLSKVLAFYLLVERIGRV